MLMAAMICMCAATVIFAGSACFFKKNKTLIFLLHTFALISLACLAIVVANYKNNFSGYTVLLILSILPQFLMLFDLKSHLDSKIENLPPENIVEEKIPEEENKKSKKKTKINKHNFLNSQGKLLIGVATLLTAVCIGICGLYIGLEIYHGFLIGLAIAFALTFLSLIIKKNINPYDLLSLFLMFLGVGILIGQSVTVLLYSFSLTNILFMAGSMAICISIILNASTKSTFNHVPYYLGMICLLCTLIF